MPCRKASDFAEPKEDQRIHTKQQGKPVEGSMTSTTTGGMGELFF